MSHSNEDPRFSDDLQHVADVLRDGRPTLDPLALDRVKLRAMNAAQRSTSTNKGSHMKQRLTTLIAAGLLTLGTGGTLALAGGGGGSASFHQYKPPCDHGKGRGGDHECHGHEGEGGQGGGDKGGQGGGDKGGQGGGGKGGGQGGGDKGGQGGGKGADKGGGQSSGGDKGGGQGHGADKGGHGHH
jgi:hypothetical protein